MPTWLEEADQNRGNVFYKLLVGNKADMEDQREVSRDEGESFAEENDMVYLESSAKTGLNVFKIFQ